MDILFLSQLLPYPANAGPKIRSYYTLRALVQAGHQVTLLAFARADDSQDAFDHLRGLGIEVLTVPITRSRLKDIGFLAQSLATGQPFLITRDKVAAMTKMIQSLVGLHTYDAVHVDQLWMAQYGLAAAAGTDGSPPRLILDQHNAVYLIPQRLAESTGNPLVKLLLRREARVLKRYEQAVCRQFDHVVWVTEEDRHALSINCPDGFPIEPPTPEAVIPICVDVSERTVIQRSPAGRRVIFLGGLHWPPNAQGMVWFVEEVWPHILEAVPDACLTVIGKDPPRALESARSESIEITGYVADVDPYLRETAAFIVPLHAGGGMRVKMIDAWSWGLPVVATTIGAEGTRYEPGRNMLIGDTAAEFAQAVIEMLVEPGRRDLIAREGRRTAETSYDWPQIYREWDKIYAQVN